MLWGDIVRNAANLGKHPQEWQVLFIVTIRILFNPTMKALSQLLSATTTSQKCTLHLSKQCERLITSKLSGLSHVFYVFLTNICQLNKHWKCSAATGRHGWRESGNPVNLKSRKRPILPWECIPKIKGSTHGSELARAQLCTILSSCEQRNIREEKKAFLYLKTFFCVFPCCLMPF